MENRTIRTRTLLLALATLYFATASVLDAKSPKEIYDENRRSVVMLLSFSGNTNTDALGSGVVISDNGDIATNLHVIRDSKGVVAKLWNGSVLIVTGVSAFDEEMDLAILRTSGTELPTVRIAGPSALSVGDEVVSIGNPLGLEGSLGTGVVSGFRNVGQGRLIQTTVPLSPGSSGGGLFDSNGELVGITTASLAQGQGLNFAVSADYLDRLTRHEPPIGLGTLGSHPTPGPNAGAEQSAAKPRLDDLIEKAGKYLAAEMFREAEDALVAAKAADEFNPRIHFLLGELWFSQRAYAQAIGEFKIAYNLDPSSATPLCRLGLSAVEAYNSDPTPASRAVAGEALQNFLQVVEPIPSDQYSSAADLTVCRATLKRSMDIFLDVHGVWVEQKGSRWNITQGSDGEIAIVGVTPFDIAFGALERDSYGRLTGRFGGSMGRCKTTWAVALQQSRDGSELTGTASLVKQSRSCVLKQGAQWFVVLRRE
jgi:hypothetical protein